MEMRKIAIAMLLAGFTTMAQAQTQAPPPAAEPAKQPAPAPEASKNPLGITFTATVAAVSD
jgi:hypothetical protein